MRKALEKGAAYVATELARLEKMAAGKMSAAKSEEISKKIAVLSDFLESEEAAEEPIPEVTAELSADDDEEEDDDE